MTRIYLQLRDHIGETLDDEGVELADLDAVKKAALDGARDVMGNEVKSEGLMDLRYRIDAENDAGQIVHSLPFKDAVEIIAEAA